MIGYFILGVCLLAALGLCGKVMLTADPKALAKILRYTGFGICAALAAFLLLTGRFALGLPLVFAAVAFLRRWALPRLGPRMGRGPSQSAGRSSNVETAYLRMALEHDSGVMRGEVLLGAFAGRDLSNLDQAELIALLTECRQHDPEAAQLLEAFLDRSAGPEWRQSAGGNGQQGQQSHPGNMTLDEAREVLGLDINPSPSEIREAYKQLMLKNHPDKGGSSYLAAKINQAKDLLLGV
ncbi:MAG: molecular chaperone DnaJ [Alphaproteobacteria bacterium]